MNNLFLVGYRGTGKSTAAKLVGQRLGWDWLDADTVLETKFGRSIRQIFADEGEAGFRERESAVLAEICASSGLVVATGGGVILRPENRLRLRQNGKTVWLKADALVIWEPLQADAATAERRPALTIGGFAEIQDLLRRREPLYAECADWIVDTTGLTPEEVVDQIMARLPRDLVTPGESRGTT